MARIATFDPRASRRRQPAKSVAPTRAEVLDRLTACLARLDTEQLQIVEIVVIAIERGGV